MFDYEVKLHLGGCCREFTIQLLVNMVLTQAEESDRKVFETTLPSLSYKYLLWDKTYLKEDKPLFIENQVEIFIPKKRKKGKKSLIKILWIYFLITRLIPNDINIIRI